MCTRALTKDRTQSTTTSKTQALTHDDGVVQRVTDGHVPVVGHEGEEEAVKISKL